MGQELEVDAARTQRHPQLRVLGTRSTQKYLPPSPALSLSLIVLQKYGCFSRVIKHYVKDPKKLRAVPSFDK